MDAFRDMAGQRAGSPRTSSASSMGFSSNTGMSFRARPRKRNPKAACPCSGARSPREGGPAGRTRTPNDGRSEETRLNSSHLVISYAVFCLKKKKKKDYSNINKKTQTKIKNQTKK